MAGDPEGFAAAQPKPFVWTKTARVVQPFSLCPEQREKRPNDPGQQFTVGLGAGENPQAQDGAQSEPRDVGWRLRGKD